MKKGSMTIKDLKAQKSEWLKQTASRAMLKRKYKLNNKDIFQIRPVVRYGKERYKINAIKEFLDKKIFYKNLGKEMPTRVQNKIKKPKNCKEIQKIKPMERKPVRNQMPLL